MVPWFVKGLRCLDELFARPRADPRVLFRTVLHVLRVVRWSPSTTRSPPLRTLRVERALSPELGCFELSFHSRHGRELRRAACVATLVRGQEHLVAEPVPRRSAHCAFPAIVHCADVWSAELTSTTCVPSSHCAWRSLFLRYFTSLRA